MGRSVTYQTMGRPKQESFVYANKSLPERDPPPADHDQTEQGWPFDGCGTRLKRGQQQTLEIDKNHPFVLSPTIFLRGGFPGETNIHNE
jgi:hypothetical protein